MGFLVLGPAPCGTPALVVDWPLFCGRGFVYPDPTVFLSGGSDPVALCVPLPPDPAFAGMHLCLQGISLDQPDCFKLTDALETILRRP